MSHDLVAEAKSLIQASLRTEAGKFTHPSRLPEHEEYQAQREAVREAYGLLEEKDPLWRPEYAGEEPPPRATQTPTEEATDQAPGEAPSEELGEASEESRATARECIGALLRDPGVDAGKVDPAKLNTLMQRNARHPDFQAVTGTLREAGISDQEIGERFTYLVTRAKEAAQNPPNDEGWRAWASRNPEDYEAACEARDRLPVAFRDSWLVTTGLVRDVQVLKWLASLGHARKGRGR